MISPLFMFLETLGVWIAGAAIAVMIDYWGRKRVANRVELSGVKPEPSMVAIWMQRLIALSMLAYPPYVIYREASKAQAYSSVPPQPAQCRARFGPIEKKWQC